MDQLQEEIDKALASRSAAVVTALDQAGVSAARIRSIQEVHDRIGVPGPDA